MITRTINGVKFRFPEAMLQKFNDLAGDTTTPFTDDEWLELMDVFGIYLDVLGGKFRCLNLNWQQHW